MLFAEDAVEYRCYENKVSGYRKTPRDFAEAAWKVECDFSSVRAGGCRRGQIHDLFSNVSQSKSVMLCGVNAK